MRVLADIALSARDRAAIERAADVLRERFPVEQIILFGSKARGEDEAESDIDLLVLTRRPLSWPERCQVVESLFPIQLEFDVVFSTLEVAVQEWFEGLYQVLPLRQEVDRDGVAA